MTITADKVTAKKLRIIEQIDRALIVLDREESGYDYIVDTMSVMQLQTIKGELFDEIWYTENRPQKITINGEIKRWNMKKN
jgi:hypothetical protein